MWTRLFTLTQVSQGVGEVPLSRCELPCLPKYKSSHRNMPKYPDRSKKQAVFDGICCFLLLSFKRCTYNPPEHILLVGTCKTKLHELKLQPTGQLTGVKCRATCVAEKGNRDRNPSTTYFEEKLAGQISSTSARERFQKEKLDKFMILTKLPQNTPPSPPTHQFFHPCRAPAL